MKTDKILLITALCLTLLLLFMIQFEKPISEGKISKIISDKKSTKIYVENQEIIIWVQNKTKLALERGDYIAIYGKIAENTNNSLIFTEKILVLYK